MMHHSRRQCVETHKVGDFACHLQQIVARSDYSHSSVLLLPIITIINYLCFVNLGELVPWFYSTCSVQKQLEISCTFLWATCPCPSCHPTVLKVICNDFLAVKVNCSSSVFNIIKSIWTLRNIKNKKILEKSIWKCAPDYLFTFYKWWRHTRKTIKQPVDCLQPISQQHISITINIDIGS